MEQCHFLIPDPQAFPSGGNTYNAHLMAALRRRGIHVSHAPFQPHILHASPHTHYVLDSIYFNQIDRPHDQLPAHCTGLVHHLESLFPLSDAQFERSERALLSHFSGLIVTSDFTKDYLIRKGLETSRISVIEPAPLLRLMQRTPQGKVRGLMLGNCTPRKGQLPFLEALAGSGIPPFFTLTIAGDLTSDPDYANACLDVTRHSPVLSKCVRFTGAQDPEVIHRLYREANLYLSASRMETYGMAIQDAVASGMPAIVHTGGFAGEHVREGQNGLRCESIPDMIRALVHCVVATEYFIALQERAASHDIHYITWDRAAELFAEKFLYRNGPETEL